MEERSMLGGEMGAEACVRQWITFGFPMRHQNVDSTPATEATEADARSNAEAEA